MKNTMKWLYCMVLVLSLALSGIVLTTSAAELSTDDLLVYYTFDGENMYANSGTLGADYDCYPTAGDFYRPDGAVSNGTVDSYPGLGKAADLNAASNTWIQVPNRLLTKTEGSFTISFWYEGNEAVENSEKRVVDFIGNGIAFWLDFQVNNDFMRINISDNDQAIHTLSTNQVSSVGWHMYTLTVKEGDTTDTVNFYVDGLLVQSDNTFKVFDYAGRNALDDNLMDNYNGFGGSSFGTPLADGAIDEFRLYGDALSGREVAKLYSDPYGLEDYVYPTEEKILSTIEPNKEVKDSGDNYGMKFENLAAGVYKIAYYMTIDSARDGAQMRISPIVSGEGYSYRCWIDWKTTVEMNGHTGVKTFMEANDTNKVILISVITVPENGATIDAGFWQDDQAYIGTLDKVALATDGYDFIADTEYTWVDEKGYRGNEPETTFNEDAQQKILAKEGDWTMSTRKTSGDGENKGDGETEKPVTGDISMVVAVLVAVGAAFGGRKLRRK